MALENICAFEVLLRKIEKRFFSILKIGFEVHFTRKKFNLLAVFLGFNSIYELWLGITPRIVNQECSAAIDLCRVRRNYLGDTSVVKKLTEFFSTFCKPPSGCLNQQKNKKIHVLNQH